MVNPMFTTPFSVFVVIAIIYSTLVFTFKRLFPTYKDVKADDIIDSLIRPPIQCEGMEVVDWSRIRPSNGDAHRESLIAERFGS